MTNEMKDRTNVVLTGNLRVDLPKMKKEVENRKIRLIIENMPKKKAG
jgi:hypothetical protein